MSKCLVCGSKAKNEFCKEHRSAWKRFIWVTGRNYMDMASQVEFLKKCIARAKAVK